MKMINILLIEPDRVLASTYSKWLNSLGYSVRTASGAQSAIHAADAAMPDIVLLELQLARHNGVDFLYEFRSYPEWHDIPVVLHTLVPASGLLLDQNALKSLGVAAYLYKPTTTLITLARTIKELLGDTDFETYSDDRHYSLAQ
jgi:CheY-like chemotaxis protein